MKIFNQIEWDRIEVSRKGAKLGKVTNSFVNFAPLRLCGRKILSTVFASE